MVHSSSKMLPIHRPRCSEGITNLLPGCLQPRFAHLDVSGRLLNDPKKKGLKLQWLLVSFCDEFEARSFLNHILYPKPLMFPVIITKFRTPPMMLERIHNYVAAAKQRLDDCRSASTYRTQPEDFSGAPLS